MTATAEDSGQIIVASEQTYSPVEFATSVAQGLSDTSPWLSCMYLYDEDGSRLFEQITEQPEYYPTRTESAILAKHAPRIAAVTGDVTLIELGSGYSVKTDHLLRAYKSVSPLVRYVPVDISPHALEQASHAIDDAHPEVHVTGIAGTYSHAFPLFAEFSPSMVIFLGSTIGNLNEQEAAVFWRRVSGSLAVGDYFLLGVDLVKDKAILDAAYNDAAGVTSRFTRNLFARVNRELGASVDLSQLEHVAEYSVLRQRIETYVRFLTDQDVRLEPIDTTITVPAGTMVMTEISRKFELPQTQTYLETFGFVAREVFTDPCKWFGVLLLQREG